MSALALYRSRSSRSHSQSRSNSPPSKKKKRSYSPLRRHKKDKYDDYDDYYYPKDKRSTKRKRRARSRSLSQSPPRYSSKASKKYPKEKRRSHSPLEKSHRSRKHRNGHRDASPRERFDKYEKYRRWCRALVVCVWNTVMGIVQLGLKKRKEWRWKCYLTRRSYTGVYRFREGAFQNGRNLRVLDE